MRGITGEVFVVMDDGKLVSVWSTLAAAEMARRRRGSGVVSSRAVQFDDQARL